MKILLSLLLLISFVNAKTIVLIDDKDRGIYDVKVDQKERLNVQFRIKEMDAEDVGDVLPYTFQKIKFKQLGLTQNSGLPALPFYSILVSAHPNKLSIKANLGVEKRLKNILPLPAPKAKYRCDECSQDEYEIDWAKYQQVDQKFYQVDYLGDFRGTPLSRVTFFPARVSNDSLSIYPQAQFEVGHDSRQQLKMFNSADEVVSQARKNYRYLIISPRQFLTDLEELVDWKESLGYEVELVALESVGSSFSAIKKYIHDRYAEQEFTYALLVGHEKSFPTEYVRTSSSSRTPSDLHYFTMGGNDDLVPDVFYGRLVVNSSAHVKGQIAKIIEYEKGEFGDHAGLYRHIGIASNQGSSPSDVQYVKQMLAPFKDAYDMVPSYIFESSYGHHYDNPDLNTLLSEGAAFLNYIGHGMGTYWPSMDKSYYSTYVSKIKPAPVKPIIIDVACENGSFKYTGKMLGERFMNSTNGGKPVGAVAYYGGSVSISWHPPAIMAVGISKMVVQYKLKHLGEALLGGQIYLYKNHSNASEVAENFKWYHLFGDPSLQMRIGSM